MTSRVCLRSNPLIASFEVHNDIGNRQDLFRIRIGFSILIRESSPELGSDYGTKPSRSFHEETVPPHYPGNRAHPERIPQRVCQRVHQYNSPRLVHNHDRKPCLLRRRSGRAWWTGLLRLRSGVGRHASHCRCGNVDQVGILLRRRSGRSGWTGLLRLRSGVDRHASQCRNFSIDQTRLELIQVGRLSVRRDGQ
jgi:hypothetical protein